MMGASIREQPMKRHRRRKCRHCGQLYEPDYRNLRHQRYCAQPVCRQASKVKSQRRWARSVKGWDYCDGTAALLRVRRWRERHPRYWRRRRQQPVALQDFFRAQPHAAQGDTPVLNEVERRILTSLPTALSSEQAGFDPRQPHALQDLFSTQLSLQLGLIEQLSGALHDDIAPLCQRLILRGRQIRGCWNGAAQRHVTGQTSAVPGAPTQGAGAVQLDRPAPGSG
jgi:hypothetical protein